jgi:hypothetical protein
LDHARGLAEALRTIFAGRPRASRPCTRGGADHVWLRRAALADFRRPPAHDHPTWANLETLSGFPTTATLAASRQRPIVPILPILVERDGGAPRDSERRLPDDGGRIGGLAA